MTLVPVIGLVHVGFQGIADRYTYLPSLGLSVALALRRRRARAAAARAGARAARARTRAARRARLLTARQVGFWRDGFSLYARALAVTADNFAIHAFLANELADASRRPEAIAHFRAALRIRPDFPHAHYGLGVTLEETGDVPGAIDAYRAALRTRIPTSPKRTSTWPTCSARAAGSTRPRRTTAARSSSSPTTPRRSTASRSR